MINYHLRAATINDEALIFNFKLETVIGDNNISDEERQKIENYIKQFLKTHLTDYKIIMDNDKIIGVYCLYLLNDNDYLLDELYLIKEYRHLGIGTSIIKQFIDAINKENKKLYLWVYKNNELAIKLYHKLGFSICNETGTRYQMKYIAEK